MSALETILATAVQNGWAAAELDPDVVAAQAARLEWEPTPVRRGAATAVRLRPVAADSARPRSLSARYGLGAQPLHTDGAHLSVPPDVLVLFSAQPTATDTLLWQLPPAGPRQRPSDMPFDELTHGMFLVENGADSFYAPVRADHRRVRYDPGCMSACDARAARVAAWVTDQLPNAVRHTWQSPGLALLIDNRHVLHARAAVAADDEDRELTRMAFTIHEQVDA